MILSFWVCVTRLYKVPKITSQQYLGNISRKTRRMKLIFCLQINIKNFFKLILSFQVCVARHSLITQNNKLAIGNILRKNRVMKLIFCIQISMKVFHKLILRFLIGHGQTFPKLPDSKFSTLYNILKKTFDIKLIFCMQINIKVSYKLISTL